MPTQGQRQSVRGPDPARFEVVRLDPVELWVEAGGWPSAYCTTGIESKSGAPTSVMSSNMARPMETASTSTLTDAGR